MVFFFSPASETPALGQRAFAAGSGCVRRMVFVSVFFILYNKTNKTCSIDRVFYIILGFVLCFVRLFCLKPTKRLESTSTGMF